MSASSSTTRTLSPITTSSLGRHFDLKRLLRRYGKREGTPSAYGTFQPDLSPVHLHKDLRNGQAEPRPSGFLFSCLVNLIEPVEDFPCLFRRDTRSRVRNGDLHPLIPVPVDGNAHFSMGRGEFDRIAD